MATRGGEQKAFEISPESHVFVTIKIKVSISFKTKFYLFVLFLSSIVTELPLHINEDHGDVL